MYPRQPVPAEILTLAEHQAHVVTLEQCTGLGLSRDIVQRLVGQHTWQPLSRGVYYVSGSQVPWHAWAWGGVLAAGEGAMLARSAAAFEWKLTQQAPDVIDILIAEHRKVARQNPRWRFLRTRNMPQPHGSPPRTPLPETVVDVCSLEPERAASCLSAALHTRRTSESAILAAVQARPRVRGRATLLSMLDRSRAGIESELEQVYATIERSHGLPRGRRQVRAGQYRRDVDYGGLIVELDGRLGHDGESRFRDMYRDNHHLVAGKMTLRYGWVDCNEHSCDVAFQVASVLRRLGWTEPYQGCPRCHAMVIAEGLQA
ncbi:type IV toxin-antitoxin system AbiEi family antitoxin domain-containing protein [Brooklawnia cerclae]|uniref:DUF559 domain-containing protein n=1 Tax=Brooklawnia cerclae TaxID=349934 RepID=A0ABX0SJR9_9ACTN|nr:type IV toxin-antitoxin system AbiEi family antitoxin domain-containing protein [Brooklawnia cerclae]NIH58647.1 hypothetical protein [Brooklawnia cerclae]